MGAHVIPPHVERSNIHQGEGKVVTMFDAICMYKLWPSGAEVEPISEFQYAYNVSNSIRPN